MSEHVAVECLKKHSARLLTALPNSKALFGGPRGAISLHRLLQIQASAAARVLATVSNAQSGQGGGGDEKPKHLYHIVAAFNWLVSPPNNSDPLPLV